METGRMMMQLTYLGFLFIAAAAEEISFDGNGYIRYNIRRRQFNPSLNRIDLQFRTTHPSGLLVFLMGKSGDSLQLQLIQGLLRLTLKKNHVIINEALAGQKLDDNRWHRVHILRIGRLLDIILDDNSEKTILIPGFSTELYVNWLLFIGGTTNAPTQNLKTHGNDMPIRFKGCLRLISIDNKQPINALRNGDPDIEIHGIKSRPCQSDIFNPVQFSSPQSVMELNQVPASAVDREMKIQLQFRTFDSDGTIVFAEGKRCHFFIGVQSKKVFLEMKQDEVLPAKVEISTDVSNGLWHAVEATITQTAIFLKTNNGPSASAALPKITSAYYCSLPSRVLIGGGASRKMKRGFVGCLNNIRVNDHDIKAFEDSSVILKGPVTAGCKIKDKCFPSPCRNGGICYQTWHSYGCDCSETTFYGKHCSIPIYKATCAGYKAIGLKKNSFCILDSDMTGRLSPYTASCNVTKDNEVMTVVHHDRAKKMNITDATDVIRGSYFHVINYELGIEHIEALIRNSAECRQFLKFDCYNTALLNSPSGPPNALWQTRTGEVKSYWGGVPEGNEGCKCGLTRSCQKRDKLCNCDSLNNKWVEDSGYVTNKELLPISRLHFTGIHHGFAYITLGPLECFGGKDQENADERPTDKILSKVCMSGTTKKYMLSNDTKLVWLTPAEELKTVKKIGTVATATQAVLTRDAKGKSHNELITDGNKSSMTTKQPPQEVPEGKSTRVTNQPQTSKRTPINAMRSFDINFSLPAKGIIKTNIPLNHQIGSLGERNLTVLEIVLIVFAALAISVLLIKFVLLKTIDFFRRRYQIKRLHHDINSNGTESVQALRSSDKDEVLLKKISQRKGMGAYWV